MSRSSVRLCVAVVGACALLASCSSGGDSGGSPSSTPPSTTAAPSTSSSATSASTAESSDAGTDSDLAAALLTGSDVGTGFTASAGGSDESPLPCTPSKPPLFQQAPPDDKAKVVVSNTGKSVQLSETLGDYDDESGAEQAFTAGSAGFSCARGTVGGQSVRIVTRQATPGGPIDELKSWDFAAGQVLGTAVLARIGQRIMGITIIASRDAASSVDVRTVSNTALMKAAS